MTNLALRDTPPMIDLNLFFERVYCVTMLVRCALIFDVARDEVLARRMFPKADSVKGRLRVIVHLLTMQEVEEPRVVLS